MVFYHLLQFKDEWRRFVEEAITNRYSIRPCDTNNIIVIPVYPNDAAQAGVYIRVYNKVECIYWGGNKILGAKLTDRHCFRTIPPYTMEKEDEGLPLTLASFSTRPHLYPPYNTLHLVKLQKKPARDTKRALMLTIKLQVGNS